MNMKSSKRDEKVKKIFSEQYWLFFGTGGYVSPQKTLRHEQYFSNAQQRISWIKPPRKELTGAATTSKFFNHVVTACRTLQRVQRQKYF